ncbi:hypothetical protein QJQ45_008935 [Haematococcus lacustris]|nr:hypothetical protein QJQ45_008935 [Haematococcus lacustris]
MCDQGVGFVAAVVNDHHALMTMAGPHHAGRGSPGDEDGLQSHAWPYLVFQHQTRQVAYSRLEAAPAEAEHYAWNVAAQAAPKEQRHLPERLSQEATPVAEIAANVPKEAMDINTAVRVVLKKALQHDGLSRGLHEAARAIEKAQAQLCILAEDTDSPDYKKLIEALCAEQNVNLISVPTKLQLGEMAGLCRIDAEGKAQNVVACSCAVVTDYGEESEGLSVLNEYLKRGPGRPRKLFSIGLLLARDSAAAMPTAEPSTKPAVATADGRPMRKRGKPLGSKNKPKPAPTTQVTPTPTRKKARLVSNTSSNANSSSASNSIGDNSSSDASNEEWVAGAAAEVAGRTRSVAGVAGQAGATTRVAGRTKSATGAFALAKAAAWVTARARKFECS